jgi:Flp pilus assembly protein TadD
LGQVPQAVDTCAKAVSQVPYIAQAGAIYARALMLAGRRDEARAEANRAFALDPANAPAKAMRQRLE